ncbi:hypothetical protein [Actinoplanes sp. N902-109]|uniref:hypothetical protein n=1 Tax=Actinoplanes sp. (strain N902-109) TaxID=649831 RepID=UPI0003294BDE|nr:hypothetical protein [Actinoplanes sp. N902-109]AGL13858.1 hypothetical protein L083_0348 [Actinoplanes sp. N902-109]
MRPIRAHVHLETTAPTVTLCARCRRTVIVGLAEGIPARVDPTPIAPAAEAALAAAGRQTYTLRRTGLIQRDASRRADRSLASPVLAQHQCPGQPNQQLSLLSAPGGTR